MDPTVTLRELLDALRDHDRGTAIDRLGALSGWLGRGAGGLNHSFGQAEVQRIVTAGDIEPEMAEEKLLTKMLLENDAQRCTIGGADRVRQFEGGGVALNRGRASDSPAILTTLDFTVNGLVDREISSVKVSASF